MTDNVIELGPRIVGEEFKVDVDAVLEGAKGKCDFVLVIGRSKECGHPYVACSHGQVEALIELELAKHWMLQEILEART